LHASLPYPGGSSAINFEPNDCDGAAVVVLDGRVLVVSGSVVDVVVAVVVPPDDDDSPGLTNHQIPSAPRTTTNTTAAATIGIHGTLLPGRGGPGSGGGAVDHIGPLGGPLGGAVGKVGGVGGTVGGGVWNIGGGAMGGMGVTGMVASWLRCRIVAAWSWSRALSAAFAAAAKSPALA
jgi:hypothetical protein